MNLENYGSWAVAFGLLLVTFREVILAMLKSKDSSRPDALAELARALDKLSGVLERMEKSQDKGLSDILNNQREILRLLADIRGRQGGGD